MAKRKSKENKAVCSACGQEKSRDEFYVDLARRDGITSQCKACRSAGRKRYYAANKEKVKARVKAYAARNKKKISDNKKNYYRDNCDVIKEKHKVRYWKNPEKARLISKKSLEKIKGTVKYQTKIRKQVLLRFDLTVEQYEDMLRKQNGVCAICKKPESKKYKGKVTRLSVDHCHKTGMIRGLLCNNCNKALGNVFDNVEILQEMVRYLKNAKEKETARESTVA